jgi:hypothetical protein
MQVIIIRGGRITDFPLRAKPCGEPRNVGREIGLAGEQVRIAYRATDKKTYLNR